MIKYRNIFFHTSKVKGAGSVDVYYYGAIFTNAKDIVNLLQQYDPTQDLYITCNTCAAKRYRSFIKVKKTF